jgi:LmbE family N-acetylglucosaminyl deacetylase
MEKIMKTALVVAAHPDDEILGCGGTVARMCAEGWTVHHLILAEGITSRAPQRKKCEGVDAIESLRQAGRDAAKILGTAGVVFGGFPDNRMDGVDLLDVVKVIDDRIQEIRPERVFTHHYGDVNVDHRIVHEAVAAATRPVPGHSVRQVLFFEIPSSTEWRSPSSVQPFHPNMFVNIRDYLPVKLAALAAYHSEMRAFPHPRSMEAVAHLAAWRGATAGLFAAEAFHVGRWID